MVPLTSSRRVRVLSLSPDAFIEFLKNFVSATAPDDWISLHGLPADAKVAGVAFDSEWEVIRLKIASDDFEEVPKGAVIPDLRLEFQRNQRKPE